MLSDSGAGTHMQPGSQTTPTCLAGAIQHRDRMAFGLSCCPRPARKGLVCPGFPRPLPASCPATNAPQGPTHPKGQGATGLYTHGTGWQP